MLLQQVDQPQELESVMPNHKEVQQLEQELETLNQQVVQLQALA